MRLIDADALMEKLNGIWDCNDMTFEPVDGCCIDADCKSCRWRETIEYVKRLVQNQPTASTWHRVEEPPKENGRYFVSWEGAVATDEYKNGVWLYASMFNQRVTYWMPIPEPPKEE